MDLSLSLVCGGCKAASLVCPQLQKQVAKRLRLEATGGASSVSLVPWRRRMTAFAPHVFRYSSGFRQLCRQAQLHETKYERFFDNNRRRNSSSSRRRVVQSALADVDSIVVQEEEDLKTDKDVYPVVVPRGETWSVHKFGGTCVGSCERIQNVAKIILKDPSLRKAVVVSAMAKVTDMMYDLLERAKSRDDTYLSALEKLHEKHKDTATALLDDHDALSKFLATLEHDVHNLRAMLRAIYIAGHATEPFADFVVGHGELWSAQMLAATVSQMGLPCVWMDAREVLVVNLTGTQQVDPDFEASDERLDKWYARTPADTIIITGFIASTADNIPTTLKRDGSDFSAAIMASLFRAAQVTIWTDVDGVYSADPKKVSEAVVLSTLSYQEAWEMSYFGANVLHPRTTMPVMKYDIPITIRNVFNVESPGTRIGRSPVPETAGKSSQLSFYNNTADSMVKGFATIDNIALVNVEGTGMAGVPGTASDIFQTVKEVGANVVMISQASSEHSICFAVPEKEVGSVAKALKSRFKRALDAGRLSQVEIVHNCSILAAVGQQMASTPGVSASLFTALAKANINVRAIAQGCSEYNITVVVDQEDSVRALKAVHSRFYLSKTTMSVGVVGPGLIGSTLLEQFKDQAAILKEEFNIDLRVTGIMGTKSMLLCEAGLDLSKWRELLEGEGEPTDMVKFMVHVKDNHFIPNAVIIDCTASAHVAEQYYKWLKKGIHIITPNKKANSGPLDQYLCLRELQRQSYTHYFYEATVGAGLPIISTLRGLNETGDKIIKIEGIFSGTVSYIFNNFKGDKSFSQIVREAKMFGFTEPDPRDDLSGMDVARKVIILARESGLRLELADIPVQSLVPEPLRRESTVEEFLEELPDYDTEIEHLRQEAEAAGEVLRYVGVVDVLANAGRVELQRYPKSHAFAQLSGSDNIIAFATSRYSKQPLIVRGPGAGAEVTAGGVFSDILRLASYLGAPS
ncbi:unnamed protein product [Sphagnum troendelagicum]|uniref:ACT domain-containing protein n=1 Tax=Sphagnum troendelagicum TaxID=128251 RepID=A0ABP0TPP5_9BRYO